MRGALGIALVMAATVRPLGDGIHGFCLSVEVPESQTREAGWGPMRGWPGCRSPAPVRVFSPVTFHGRNVSNRPLCPL